MKVYFSASVHNKEKHKESYLEIVNTLIQLGYEVISDQVLRVEPEIIDTQTEEEVDVFRRDLKKKLQEADIFVAEISTQSISVGYLITEAVVIGKPVILLKNETVKHVTLLEGDSSGKIQTALYSSSNLKKSLKRVS